MTDRRTNRGVTHKVFARYTYCHIAICRRKATHKLESIGWRGYSDPCKSVDSPEKLAPQPSPQTLQQLQSSCLFHQKFEFEQITLLAVL